MFDIQYLIKLTNFNLFKIYTPIIEQKKMKQMNNKYLYDKNNNNAKFTYDDFLKNQTIILESCTGTGKTTAVAEHTSNYLEDNKHLNVLSIISRITLGDQHIKSFNSKNIKMFSYSNGLVKNKHFIVCINSLLMMKDLKDDDFKNYIVFIDEINSFIEHLTHNETLHHDLKKIYSLLMRIIKNAHKVIVADALISDSVFTFLKARQDYFFIKNDFIGIIEKNTPIAQIIPIKRDSWSREIEEHDPLATSVKYDKFHSTIKRAYRNNFWTKKEYK